MNWNLDFEHRSTHHLLTRAPALARKFDERAHVIGEGIDWTALEDACFSDAERLLARAARDLWNRTGQAPLGELLSTLDEDNFQALMTAMRLWRERSTR